MKNSYLKYNKAAYQSLITKNIFDIVYALRYNFEKVLFSKTLFIYNVFKHFKITIKIRLVVQ